MYSYKDFTYFDNVYRFQTMDGDCPNSWSFWLYFCYILTFEWMKIIYSKKPINTFSNKTKQLVPLKQKNSIPISKK